MNSSFWAVLAAQGEYFWATFKGCFSTFCGHFFFHLELPKRPKKKNSCSKMWPIDQLYIELAWNGYWLKPNLSSQWSLIKSFMRDFFCISFVWLCSQWEAVTVNFKRLLYLAPSSGISIVWRADSWRRRHATPQLCALQTMEMPLDGTKYGWLLNLQTLEVTQE